MKNTQKGAVFVWVVVLIVILGGVSYLIIKNIQLTSSDSQVVTDNTSTSKEESRLLVLNTIIQKKITSHPSQCLSWKEVDNSGDWITWELTKEWKTWNSSCPALSPNADVPSPTIRAKANLQTKEVLIQALDGEYR
jgi:hypothetical protein